jgi:hypothetical protein
MTLPFRHGKDSKALLGKYDVSTYLTEATASMALDTAETSTFGGAAKTYLTGQDDGTISFSGLFDGDANAIDDIFVDVIDNDLTPVLTFAHDGGLVVGRKATLASVKQTNYSISAPVADIVSLSGEFQVTGGLRQGVLLAALTALTATTDGTSVDNLASSSLGATANLHVTANTRDSDSTIKIQSSADNVTFADLITFTTVGATVLTSQSSTATGTVNRYLRAQTTLDAGTGSITITISIARRK